MNSSSSLLSRLLLALALLLGSAASLPASPAAEPVAVRTTTLNSPPLFGGLSFLKGTGRAWVVRIAALGMALALFIIMRGSSRY